MVDVAADVAGEDAGAEAELVLDDRAADGAAGLVAPVAVLGRGHLGAGVRRIAGQAGRRGDEADGAALGAGPEQGALRAPQHFDALEVEQGGEGRAAAGDDADGAALLQGGVVQVDAGGGRAERAGDDAADGDVGNVVVAAAAEGHGGDVPRQVLNVLHALLVERALSDGGDAQRHPADGVGLPGGGHDHFAEEAFVAVIGAAGCPAWACGSVCASAAVATMVEVKAVVHARARSVLRVGVIL